MDFIVTVAAVGVFVGGVAVAAGLVAAVGKAVVVVGKAAVEAGAFLDYCSSPCTGVDDVADLIDEVFEELKERYVRR